MDEERKTRLIGNILEYGLHKEGDLHSLPESELVYELQKLMQIWEMCYG